MAEARHLGVEAREVARGRGGGCRVRVGHADHRLPQSVRDLPLEGGELREHRAVFAGGAGVDQVEPVALAVW
jgi:hypothetical protein